MATLKLERVMVHADVHSGVNIHAPMMIWLLGFALCTSNDLVAGFWLKQPNHPWCIKQNPATKSGFL
jgi:hypothetical protein